MIASIGLPVIATISVELHHLSVVLPKPPNRDFLNQMILVFHLTATAHLDKCKLTALSANGLLHQACGFPILHRDKAGRADHVCETQLVLRFPGVAVVESEICPVDFKFFHALGPQMADLECIFNLRDYERWKDRVDGDGDAI